jgi:hypothetical protein
MEPPVWVFRRLAVGAFGAAWIGYKLMISVITVVALLIPLSLTMLYLTTGQRR